MMQKYVLILIALLLACTTPDPVQPPDFEYVEILGQITDKKVDEVSGVAISQIADSVLWVINDSGDNPNLYAVNRSGELLGVTRLAGAENRDWEDIDSFVYEGVPYLLIAETGDNDARYGDYRIYIVAEPEIAAAVPENVDIAWHIDFTFSDGARDCEAVAVDILTEKIYLLSKRNVPPRLYQLPLVPTEEVNVAHFLGEISTIPQPGNDDIQDYLDQFSSQPTSMDISTDASQLMILTYKHLYVYKNTGQQDWPTAMATSPVKILYPRLNQAEAACFDNDQEKIIVTTEDIPAPIILVDPAKF